MSSSGIRGEPLSISSAQRNFAHTRENSGVSQLSQSPQRIQTRTANGTILYTPRYPFERRTRANPAFPTPHIRPRQRRPHTIHIVSYPPGYIPTELRSAILPIPPLSSSNGNSYSHRKRSAQNDSSARQAARKKSNHQLRSKRSTRFPRKPTAAASANPPQPTASTRTRVLEKFLSAFGSPSSPSQSPATAVATAQPPCSTTRPTGSRPASLLSLGRRLSLSRSRSDEGERVSPPAAATDLPDPLAQQQQDQPPVAPMRRNPIMADTARPASMLVSHDSGHSNRNSFMSVRSAKNVMTSSVSEITEKPVASGGGLSCCIILAEPHVFLTGFDHDGHRRRGNTNGTALLRGKLQLTVTKNVKIRSVTLKLNGKARTEWPEGVPPLKMDLFEEESLRTQALTFFHAMHESWETPYGNQCTYTLKSAPDNSFTTALSRLSPSASHSSDSNSLTAGLTAKDIKRLSLQHVQSRSFGKTDSPVVHPVQAKGYKVFFPGTYEYAFELPIDHHQLETIRLPFGSVKWQLETTIERSGAFKPNLHGSKEVSIIRVPDQLSLETVEPISISRQWEDQLYYDIIISGKSFPIGGRIPIAFKLTPLAKVQLHKLKVYVTESTEYWTNNRRVTRKDPGRKILLFEKTAGKPLDAQFSNSEINVLSGGELSPAERSEARAIATRRRDVEAHRAHHQPEPLPEPTENLLGDLDLGLESYWGATEMEMNVQIPTCSQMAKDPNLRLHPDCSWKNAHVYHWIKVVMRISRLDPEDPEGKRRRHFEISIDSPFTVLNCLATQANTALPRYSGLDPSSAESHYAPLNCGCSDASMPTTPISPAASIELSPDLQRQQLPVLPQAAHLHRHSVSSTTSNRNSILHGSAPTSDDQTIQRTASGDPEEFEPPRPIHLLRIPSYAPPAFDADDAPPMPADIMTPPPNYDAIVGTPSVDGLADYFSRLADYDDQDEGPGATAAIEDDSDSDDQLPTRITSRGGRVNVMNPRTPGARHAPSRSMDIQRPAITLNLSMPNTVTRGAE